MWPFKCKHPFKSLTVHSHKVTREGEFNAIEVTFVCDDCGEYAQKKFSTFHGGVEGFLKFKYDQFSALTK